MKSIIILDQAHATVQFCQKLILTGGAWKFVGKSISSSVQLLLKSRGILLAGEIIFSDAAKKEFIDGYNDLIDQLARQNPHRLWWASDIASKNQFSSQLPALIEEFYYLMMTVETSPEKSLLLIVSDVSLIETLRDHLSRQHYDVKVFTNQSVVGLKYAFMHFKKLLAIFWQVGRLGGRALTARWVLRDYLKILPSKKTYVLKSFLYENSFSADGGYKDTFFGPAVGVLKEQGPLIVLVYVLGNWRRCLTKIKQCRSVSLVPIEAYIKPQDLWSAAQDAIGGRINAQGISFKGYTVDDLTAQIIFRTRNGVQFWQFLHYWILRRMAEQVNIGMFMLTYENYPWERMSILALREASPSTAIHGYQHTVVPQAYLNFFPSQAEVQARVLPDKVLTTGKAPQLILEQWASRGPLVEPACALRFESLLKEKSLNPPRQPIRKVLIPLEGFYYVWPLIEYVLSQQQEEAPLTFRIRCHPLLPWPAWQKQYKFNQGRVEVSGGTLKEDLQWADAVLYWSSTVSLEAILMGRPVIHFDQGQILSYDPLFSCTSFKRVVTPQESLIQVLSGLDALSNDQWTDELAHSQAYIKQYFYPVDPQALSRFIF